MSLTRIPTVILFTVILAGCATPPGTPVSLPVNFQEQNRNMEIFRRYAPQIEREPDVLGVYLTANNNPRHLKIICRDKAARDRLLTKYGGTIEGLDAMYPVDYEPNPGDEIVAVPKVEPPKTWWERIIAAFAAWKTRVLAPNPASTPSPVTSPLNRN